MEFSNWYRNLGKEQRRRFALRANTTPEYIEIHLLPRRKTPRRGTMQALAEASDGTFTYEDIVKYFMLTSAAQ